MSNFTLSEQELHRFGQAVQLAKVITKRLFGEQYPRDVQVIASTLYIQANRLDVDDLKPLARLYLQAATASAELFPESHPSVVLSAAATLFIQHMLAQEGQQPKPAESASTERRTRPRRREQIRVYEEDPDRLVLTPQGG